MTRPRPKDAINLAPLALVIAACIGFWVALIWTLTSL